MKEKFAFLSPGELADADLELSPVGGHPADPIRKDVPWYEFEMRTASRRHPYQRSGLIASPLLYVDT